jgi:hypothetical protein
VHLSGPVVYVTLEDDPADTKQRLLELYPKGLGALKRDRLIFHHGTSVPELGEGLVDWLQEHVIVKYQPALIVLDPISYLYPQSKNSGDQFAEVRTRLLPLRSLGREHHIGILGIDHRRKKSTEDIDVFETLYGSQAKIAIADSLLLIVRDNEEITVHVRARRGADQTLTLGFSFDCNGVAHWEWKESFDGLGGPHGQYGDLRKEVLAGLAIAPGAMTIPDIVAALDLPDSREIKGNLRVILHRCVQNGELKKTTRGKYIYGGET